ncbi:MAG TPA: hypothetical protein PLP27_08355 [Crocinitomicaceae bacterium]|nr:hypothetical protein [Crocinitomicaceae bacterium]
MKKRKIIFVLSLVLVLGSCGKKVHTGQGTNTVIYERSHLVDAYEIQTAPMLQNETFVIGDVNVYQDALGLVAYSALGGATNGKPDWVKDIVIRNLKLSEHLKISLYNDGASLANNLVNCQLFFTYYPMDNSGEKKVVLANFVEYNSSKNEVIMQTTGNDLTTLFKEQVFGGQLELVFKFAQTPHSVGKMKLRYTIAFDFAYTFASKEAKKKE